MVSQIEEGPGVDGQTLGLGSIILMEDVTHEATLTLGLLRWRVEAVPVH